jgi:hypothetical protein
VARAINATASLATGVSYPFGHGFRLYHQPRDNNTPPGATQGLDDIAPNTNEEQFLTFNFLFVLSDRDDQIVTTDETHKVTVADNFCNCSHTFSSHCSVSLDR